MSSIEFSSSRCRICLQEGATYPIFDGSTMEASIHSQINKCFMEKIEDETGYPRSICSTCKLTLDMLCDFIDKYRENCTILKDSLVKVKTEVDFDNNNDVDNDDFIWESIEHIEIKVENNNENIRCDSEILGRLKLPGLKITKIKSKTCTNEKASNTAVEMKRNSKSKCLKPRKSKPKIKDTVHSRVKKLIEIGEKKVQNKAKEKKKKENEVKSKEIVPLLCDLCGQHFSKKYQLTRHIEGRHSNTKFKCPICSKEYNSEFYLRLHKQSVHSDKKFTCEHCNRQYKSRKIINYHILTVHTKKGKKNKAFACNFCNKVYKCAQSQTIHERSVHTGLRPAVCEKCGKAFFHEVYLKEHMRLHTGELPFKCPICDRGYTQRGNMKSHLRQHKISELNDTIMTKMRPSYMKCLKKC